MANSTPPKKRMVWMDVVRGLAILLVLVSHTLAAARSVDLVPHSFLGTIFDHILGPFRMPLLVFISGFLLEHSIRKGTKRYFDGKIRAVLWPFLIWTIIATVVLRESFSFDLIINSIQAAPNTIWYLQFLLFAYVGFFLIFKSKIPLYILAPFFILLSGFVPESIEGIRVSRYTYLFGILLCGVLVGKYAHQWETFCRKIPVLIATSLPTIWLAILSIQREPVRYSDVYAPWMLLSFAFICGVAMHLPIQSYISRILAFIGRNSLIYYVLHYSIMLLLFRFIVDIGWTNTRTTLLIAIILAITLLISTLVVLLQKRFPIFSIFFQLPPPRQKKK